MNPGYDRPIHEGFRRTITYDCMFCHNAYPGIPPGNEQPLSEPVYTGALPEGIDCARCHGSGAKHMQLAKTAGTKPEAIRGAIVNLPQPARTNHPRLHRRLPPVPHQRRAHASRDLHRLSHAQTPHGRRHQSEGDYQGKVVPYYPKVIPDLYLAIAQVIQRSNLTEGIAQLTAAIARQQHQRAEYYFQLAEALRNNAQPEKAIPLYREAIRRNPQFVCALQRLASTLRRAGQYNEADHYLKQAAAASPTNPITWYELGLNYQAQAKSTEAIAALQKAVQFDPDMAEAHNNLGDFQEAIRLQPNYADARYKSPRHARKLYCAECEKHWPSSSRWHNPLSLPGPSSLSTAQPAASSSPPPPAPALLTISSRTSKPS